MVTLLRLRRFCKFFFCHPCRQLNSHASSTFVQFRFCNLRKKKSFSFLYPLCGLLRSLRCDEIKFIKNIEPCHLVPFDCRSRWEVHDNPCVVCDIRDRSSPRKKISSSSRAKDLRQVSPFIGLFIFVFIGDGREFFSYCGSQLYCFRWQHIFKFACVCERHGSSVQNERRIICLINRHV